MIVSSENSHTTIKSMVGEIGYFRPWYHCRRCHEGYSPFDKDLLVQGEHRITKGFTEAVCDFAQRMASFEEASYMIKKYLGISISPSQIKIISEEIGNRLYMLEKAEAKKLYENQHLAIKEVSKSKKKGRLYIEADGSMLLTREDAWKEIKLGIAFKDTHIINRDKDRHIIVEKEYTATIESAEEFKKLLWSLAVRNNFQDVKEVVILGDGAKWVWNIAKELFPEAIFILDYYHFEEHVYECANALYPEDEVNRKIWAKSIIGEFMEGRMKAGINRLDSIKPDKEEIVEKIFKLKTYLENNIDKMNYKEYKYKGYFIGSGAIESGHKVVLQQRLKQPGMRWSRYGVQAIATLRTASKSNRWQKVQDIIYEEVG